MRLIQSKPLGQSSDTLLNCQLSKYKFLHGKNNFEKIVSGLLVLEMFQLLNGDLNLFVLCQQYNYKLRAGCPKLVHVIILSHKVICKSRGQIAKYRTNCRVQDKLPGIGQIAGYLSQKCKTRFKNGNNITLFRCKYFCFVY